MKKRGAFTLLEATVTIGLVSILLVVLGSLLSNFTRAMRFSTEKESGLQAAIDCFDALGADFSSAINITQPGNSWGTQVALTRLHPYDQARFPSTLADPTDPWSPHPANATMSVQWTYSAPSASLLRTEVYQSVTTTSQINNLEYFQCQLVAVNGVNTTAQMRVSVRRSGIVRSITHSVPLHLPPAVVP